MQYKSITKAKALQIIAGLKNRGDKGSRTPDLLNAIQTLYQLSYIPEQTKLPNH